MFKLSNVTDVYTFRNKKLLQNICDSRCGDVSGIWSFPGHVCVTLNRAARLVVFSVTPCHNNTQSLFNNETPDGQKGYLDLDFGDQRLCDIFTRTNNPGIYYIVLENGTIEAWRYSDQLWQSQGETHLVSEDIQATSVVTVMVQETFNAIYWVEKKLDSNKSLTDHTICRASLSTEGELKIQDRTSVMENCPMCDLYAVRDHLLILPRPPCPPGIYFTVSQINNTVTTHVTTRGRCNLQDKLLGKALDFHELSMKQFGLWSQSRVGYSGFRFYDYHAGWVLSLFDNGLLIDLVQNKVLCYLKLGADITTFTDCFAFRKCIILVSKQCLKVYEIQTGSLVQAIPLSELESYVSHAAVGNTGVPQMVILTTRRFYFLQMTNMNHVSNKDHCNNLSHAKADVMTTKIINIALHHYQERSMTRQKLTLEQLQQTSMFQSPQVLISLLLQAQGLQSHDQTIHQLQEILHVDGSTALSLHTQLTETLGSQLREYRDLEDQILKCFENPQGDNHISHHASQLVKEKVSHLMSESLSLSVEQKRADLIAVSTHFPDETMEAVLAYLDFSNTGETSPIKRLKWERLLGFDSDSCHDDEGEILDIICNLVFTQQPVVMLQLTEEAEKILNPEADNQHHNELICQRILSHLPYPEKSVDVTTAAIVLCKLTLKSGLKQSHQEALEVLLRLKMWEEAITFVSRCGDLDSHHSELYQVLLKAIIRRGEVTEYCESLFQVKPESLSLLEFLELLQEDLASADDNIFYQQSNKDIPISLLRPFLLQSLQNKN